MFLALPSILAVGTTDISLDDVTFVNCDPSYVPDNVESLNCEFENDTCGWYQEQHEDDFDWRYGQGSSSGDFANTGPGTDKHQTFSWRSFIHESEPSTLWLSNHTYAKPHFWVLFSQVGTSQLVDCLAAVGTLRKVSFPNNDGFPV